MQEDVDQVLPAGSRRRFTLGPQQVRESETDAAHDHGTDVHCVAPCHTITEPLLPTLDRQHADSSLLEFADVRE
jgi:hypothetical protein